MIHDVVWGNINSSDMGGIHVSKQDIEAARQRIKKENLKKRNLRRKINKTIRTTSSFCIPGYSFKLLQNISTGVVSDKDSFNDDLKSVVYKLKKKAYELKGNGLFNLHYTVSSAPGFDFNGNYDGDHIIVLASADAVKMKPVTNYEDYLNSVKAYCFNNSSNPSHAKSVDDSDAKKAKEQFKEDTKSSIDNYKQAKADEQASNQHSTFVPFPPYFLP